MARANSSDTLTLGSAAPDFQLPAVDGSTFSLSEQSGKKGYLVIFMCNHCPYVIPKLDTLVKIQTQFPDIQLIAISSNDVENYPDDSFDKMKDLSDEYNFNFPYLYDESQEIAEAYDATCTPDPFLFDGDKKLFYHGQLDPEHREASDGRSMIAAIESLLNNKEVEVISPSQGCSIKWKATHYEKLGYK